MTTLLASVLLASLVGSVHCAGMCGPWVAFGTGQAARAPVMWAYHAGRLLIYAALGFVAGSAGAAVDLAAARAGMPEVAALCAALLMIVWGSMGLARALGARLPQALAPRFLQRLLFAGTRHLGSKPPWLRGALLGLLSALLPCGWLYAFAITAAGTGAAYRGVLVMLAFWLGTVPMLVGLGAVVRRLSRPLAARVPAVAAALVILVGLVGVANRYHALRAAPSGAPPACHGQH